MRLFLAVDVPPATRDAVFAWAAAFRAPDDGWRWVAPAAVHVTLRFYGETADATLPELQRRVAGAAAAGRPSDLRVAGWGVFPATSRARVLWAGIAGDASALAGIARAAEDDARALGFAPEERAFKAHLTVARARAGARPRLPGAPAREAPDFGPLPVRELVLYRSHLGPQGARYEPLLRVPLGGSRA